MDVKKHRLPIAIALLAVVAAGTVVALVRRDAPDESMMVERTSPTRGLDRNAISAIEITRPGEETTRLEIRGDEMRITSPIGVPADASAVNQMLDRLVDIEIDSVAATKAQHHDRLEVSDPRAIHVKVFVGEDVAADLRVGAAKGRVTMLRSAGSDVVLGALGGLRHAFDKGLDELRDKRIFKLDDHAITRVTFESESGRFSFSRASGDDDFAPSPETKTIPGFDPGGVRARVLTLSRLRASSYAAGVSLEEAGLAQPKARVRLEGAGATHTLLLGDDAPNGIYAKVEGRDDVYVIPSATAQRFMPKATDFEAPPSPPGGDSSAELPAELLEQIQRQLQGR